MRWICRGTALVRDGCCREARVSRDPRAIDGSCRRLPELDDVTHWKIPVGGAHGLEIDHQRGRLYVACDDRAVVEVDAQSGAIINTWPIAGGPDVTFFNPATGLVHVAIGKPGLVQSIDPRTGASAQTLTAPAPTQPPSCRRTGFTFFHPRMVARLSMRTPDRQGEKHDVPGEASRLRSRHPRGSIAISAYTGRAAPARRSAMMETAVKTRHCNAVAASAVLPHHAAPLAIDVARVCRGNTPRCLPGGIPDPRCGPSRPPWSRAIHNSSIGKLAGLEAMPALLTMYGRPHSCCLRHMPRHIASHVTLHRKKGSLRSPRYVTRAYKGTYVTR